MQAAIPEKDIAIVYKLHIGLLRSGQSFMECIPAEYVLGDVPHKDCVELIATLVRDLAEMLMKVHAAKELTKDEIKKVVSEVNDDDQFFSGTITLSEE